MYQIQVVINLRVRTHHQEVRRHPLHHSAESLEKGEVLREVEVHRHHHRHLRQNKVRRRALVQV